MMASLPKMEITVDTTKLQEALDRARQTVEGRRLEGASVMGHRWAFLKVSKSLLTRFFRDGKAAFEVIENPLPPDAMIVGASVDSQDDRNILLLVESNSFDPVKLGELIPDLPDILFRRTDG